MNRKLGGSKEVIAPTDETFNHCGFLRTLSTIYSSYSSFPVIKLKKALEVKVVRSQFLFRWLSRKN